MGVDSNQAANVSDHPSQQGTPGEGSSGPPSRDLYAVSDIRFVMLEIGKLTAQVERLISDVRTQGGKLDEISHKISFVQGAMWVFGVVWAIGIVALGAYLRAH